MTKYIQNKSVYVEKSEFIFRVFHKTLEGDCQTEHGPILSEIGPLYCDIYPVTNKMYFDFLKESSYRPENPQGFLRHFEGGIYRAGDENKPVVNVSFEDAEAYAKFYGKRLPTEIEWQYLATGKYNLRYPWGNGFNKNFCNSCGEELCDVNAHPEGSSPFGLYDMCGNAFEMTQKHTHAGHDFLLLRGGSFYCGDSDWHTEGGALKNNSHVKMPLLGGAMERASTVGFRCVKEAE